MSEKGPEPDASPGRVNVATADVGSFRMQCWTWGCSMELRCYALSALEMVIRVVSEDQKKSDGNVLPLHPMSEMNTVERFTKGVGSYEASCRKCDA